MGKKKRTISEQAPFSLEPGTPATRSSSCKKSPESSVAKSGSLWTTHSASLDNETAFANDSSLPFGTRSQEVVSNAESFDTGSLGFGTCTATEVEDAVFVKEETECNCSGNIGPSFELGRNSTQFGKQNVAGEIYDPDRLSPLSVSTATEASRSASGDCGAVSPLGSSVEVS